MKIEAFATDEEMIIDALNNYSFTLPVGTSASIYLDPDVKAAYYERKDHAERLAELFESGQLKVTNT